jgi:hypothetical protein
MDPMKKTMVARSKFDRQVRRDVYQSWWRPKVKAGKKTFRARARADIEEQLDLPSYPPKKDDGYSRQNHGTGHIWGELDFKVSKFQQSLVYQVIGSWDYDGHEVLFSSPDRVEAARIYILANEANGEDSRYDRIYVKTLTVYI